MSWLAVLTIAMVSHSISGGIRSLPELPVTFFTRPGDFTLGMITSVHTYDKERFCSPNIREMGALQRVEAFAFAIDEINKRQDILSNVTLGFTVMDDCSKDTTALARALHLIQNTPTTSEDQLLPVFVSGVIGCEGSKNTVQIADLLSLFKIPVLSYISTSPLLSDRYKYPFFSRIVPSDTLQAKVIVDILQKFSWTYVSVVYAQGSYGSEGYKAVKARTEEIGYCLGVVREMRESFSDEDYDDIIKDLQQKDRAKVVVLFAPLSQARALLTAAKRNHAHDQFTWIGSDGWGRNIQDYRQLEDVAMGAITVKFYSPNNVKFNDYFKHLTANNASDNPWFKDTVELEIGCSFTGAPNKTACSEDTSFASSGSFTPEITVSLVIDAVYTYAWALDQLLVNCSAPYNNCFGPEELLATMRSLTFQGGSGLVSFDAQGDGLAVYDIQNLQRVDGEYRLVSIGLWDSHRSRFTRFEWESIQWKDSVMTNGESVPTSTCSDDCAAGHQAVRTQPHCCWYCQKCRNNEKTVVQDNLPKCEICPTANNFTWPDPVTRTWCDVIEQTYTSPNDFTGIIIVCADLFTVIITVVITALYIKNNNEKLIKASSRELSYFMLCGIILSSVFVALMAVRPNHAICNITYAGFHLSFTMTYAPLTIKTNRVYRIFTAGKKSTKRPKFIDSKSQILFTLLIIVFQILILGIWMIIDSPRSQTVMPSFSEKYVEVTCKLPETGFLVSVVCNLTLVLVCTFFAIKTRKLPDNFNESRFVSFSVYTTIVLWLAFIPTYFTTSKTTLRSLFLAAAMIFNSNVALFFLYAPKLYALYYVTTEAQNLALATSLPPRPKTVAEVSHSNKVLPTKD